MCILRKDAPRTCRYIYAVYWSITTLATVGFGDFTARNVTETVWSTVYMFYNLGLSAYILGSFTLIVIRGDEQVGKYQAKCSNLKDYAKLNGLPKVRPQSDSPDVASACSIEPYATT